jgi:hypothetical protein
MGVRRFFLIIAVATTLVPDAAVRADLNYRAEITGAEDSDLADLLDKISELKTLEDKPPASEEALRRRADRDLGRLADAAHSLGYWDAEFSYEVDAAAEPAKVTARASAPVLFGKTATCSATPKIYGSPPRSASNSTRSGRISAVPIFWPLIRTSWRLPRSPTTRRSPIIAGVSSPQPGSSAASTVG